MKTRIIALFGEAEKGAFHKGTLCDSLPQLQSMYGDPPPGTLGLFFAVQSLMFQYKLIFFRVEEEGYSLIDYMIGFRSLSESDLMKHVLAIGLPGVGDLHLLRAAQPIVDDYHPLLLTTERDLQDLLYTTRSLEDVG